MDTFFVGDKFESWHERNIELQETMNVKKYNRIKYILLFIRLQLEKF